MERNLLYLREQGIKSYIKLQTHEKRKTRAYKEDIFIISGRKEPAGWIYTGSRSHGCEDCSGCEHKAKCLYRYDEVRDKDKNKVMKINETWVELQSDSHSNIESEEGILNRQIRSIQTEGHFGDIKENDQFRRFHYRSQEKVSKEFMLYAFGRNINKYHRFLYDKIKKYEGKSEQEAA